MSNVDTIISFWDWFASNSTTTRTLFFEGRHAELHSQFRFWLDRIHPHGPALNWEIGPHNDGVHFAVCPTVRENLPLARSIVAHAPRLPLWTILVGRPPKPPGARHHISLYTADGHFITIDAATWRAAVQPSRLAGCIDVVLVADSLPCSLCHNDRVRIAHLLLDNSFGEEVVLRKVGAAVVVSLADADSVATVGLDDLRAIMSGNIP